MSVYPEALIEKVARAAYDGAFLKHAPEDVDRWEDLAADNDPAAESWREVARATLDSLGFAPFVGSQYWRSAIHVEDYKSG